MIAGGKDAKGFPGGPGGFPTKGYGKLPARRGKEQEDIEWLQPSELRSGGKGEQDAWQMGQMSMKALCLPGCA